MENNKINSVQIPYLVRLTADLFREMNEEIDPVLRPGHMHFVTDLLKDLVDMAYPRDEGPYIGIDSAKGNDYTGAIEVTKDNETGCVIVTETTPFNPELIEKALENISKITKSYKPPKAGEF